MKNKFYKKPDMIEHFKVLIRNHRGRVYKVDTHLFMYNFECNTVLFLIYNVKRNNDWILLSLA